MNDLKKLCEVWLRDARAKLHEGALQAKDLDQLAEVLEQDQHPDLSPAGRRQRLMYLHAVDPSIHASVIGMALHEPVAGGEEKIGQRDEWPYATVHEAIQDGWQVIHFPNQLVGFDDREIDILGYEFILQKWSNSNDNRQSSP